MERNVSETPTMKVVLTPPQSLIKPNGNEEKQESIFSRVLDLFQTISPGSDLTKFQLPPQFNMPKSQLQLYGESVYCYSEDLLNKCVKGKTPLERFNSVVAWAISTTRPATFGKAPYNPILGETHHVSCGRLNVILEQVSHHPPISVLHATDDDRPIEITWWQCPVPRFTGSSVEATIHGRKELKLLEFNETYEMNSPKLCIHLFPVPRVEWIGDVHIHCKQSGLKALINFKGKSFFGLKGSSTEIGGKIMNNEKLYELRGNWDGIVMCKDIETGKTTVFYDAKRALSNLKTPTVQKNVKDVATTESAMVWAELSESILRRDWRKAKEAKTKVEEDQRMLRKFRDQEQREWKPCYFTKTSGPDSGWEYSKFQQKVPPAPIVIPK